MGEVRLDIRFYKVTAIAGLLPVLFFTMSSLLLGKQYPGLPSILLDSFMSVFYTMSISTVVALTWNNISKRFPWEKAPWKRILADFIVTNTIAGVTMVVLVFPVAALTKGIEWACSPEESQSMYGKNVLVALVMNTILVSVFEGMDFFMKWKQSLVERERLEKENVLARFQSLKNQVNPHFLFNSLNTLSSLVHDDADRAEDFIDEMSRVFRYVLEVDDRDLVLLREELDFVESYYFLNRIRFGDNLRMELKVDPELRDALVPPLSCQLLFENAVKHNRVTDSEPLTIRIYTEKDALIVSNNLQERQDDYPSTGKGLTNLTARYDLFGDRLPEYRQTENEFKVTLPLLKPADHEGDNH